MRKEVLIAIIIGFVLGLLITFGVWTANKAIQKSQTSEEKAPEEQNVSPTPTQSTEKFSLSITSPEEGFISNQEKIKIDGKTEAGASVAFVYPAGSKIIEAGNDGSFTQEVELNGGLNEITIAAFDSEGNEVIQKLNVVYSTAEI